jgi:hypothetical protein
MRLSIYALLITGSLFLFSPEYAHARNWKRAQGALKMTYYESNNNDTIDDVSPENRVIRINTSLNRRSSQDDISSQCRDNRASKQRVCNASWTYEVQGLGTCRYASKTIYNNYTSSSKKLTAYLELLMVCSNGYEGYGQYSGRVTRS